MHEVVVKLTCRVDDPLRGWPVIDGARLRTKEGGCSLQNITFRLPIKEHGAKAAVSEIAAAIRSSKFAWCPTCRLDLSSLNSGFSYRDAWTKADKETPLLSEL